MNFPFIINNIIIVIEILLFIIIYFRGFRDPINKTFLFLLLAILSWVISSTFYNIWESEKIATLWILLRYTGPLFIPTVFTYFVYTFLGKLDNSNKHIIFILLFIPNIIFATITGITNLVVNDISFLYQGGYFNDVRPIFGPLYSLYSIYYIIYFLWGDILLFMSFGKEKLRNAQIFYLLAGSIVAIVVGMITNLFLPYLGNFDYFWLGPTSTLVFAVFIIYAIITHHILNINIVSTEVFTGILMILLLVNVFTFSSLQDLLFKSAIFGGGMIVAFLLIIRSLRELRHTEEIETLNSQLNKSMNELKKIDELKTEFVSLASHQLRTPLTPIKGFSSMLLEGSIGSGVVADQEQRNAIKMINESANRMDNLIDDILDVSKLEKEGGFTYKFELQNPEEIVKKVVDDFAKQAKDKGLELSFTSTLLPTTQVKLDPAKFTDAIGNLLLNAIHYTVKGNVWVKIVEEGGSIIISVKDTGVGIEPDDMTKLFQKFFRGKEMARLDAMGTGLGLYFTRHVIEDHGGLITVKSEGPQKGSEFIVTLPKIYVSESMPPIDAPKPAQEKR